MYRPQEHDSPAASDEALDLTGSRCSNVNFDQISDLTSAQPPRSASAYDGSSFLPPSSGLADESISPPSGYPSSWNSESVSGFGHPFAYGQPSTLDNPLASSGQSLLVYLENAGLTAGIGQSTASDAFEATEQEQSSFGASADELFQVSLASESDLEKVSDVHARVSIDNPLACCTIWKPKDFSSHLELGRFHYGQAFAAKAVVLKVTNQVSGEVVGCAWLQVHLSLEKHNIRVPISRHGVSLPSCLKRTIYNWIHQKAHSHHRRAVKEGTQNYLKARAQPQTSLSDAWPSPVAEVWPPRSLPPTTNPATCGDLDELSPKEQRDHDSGRRAGSGEARKAQQQVAVSEEQGPSSAHCDQQTLAGQQPPSWTENPQQPEGTPQSYQRRVPPNEQYGQPQLGQSQQPANQAISFPKNSPAPFPIITVNFFADSAHIFETPTQSVPASFNYLSYRGVSAVVTVNYLISKLRLKNAMLKGVTMICEMRVGDGRSALRKGDAGMTILEGSEMAERRLAEVGWGPEASPVWLVGEM